MSNRQNLSKIVSPEEQDRIIAEMQAQQKKLLERKSLPSMADVKKGLEKNAPVLVLLEMMEKNDIDGATNYLLAMGGEKIKPDDGRAFKHSSRPLFDEKKSADVKQVGKVRVAEVEVREDQADFRRRITLNFGGKCAISGHDTAGLLQAAHIQPFSNERNNNTSNGILLDVALHVLFDRGLMVINPDDFTVSFKCNHPYAGLYEGVKLATPKVALDVEALRIHYNRYN